MMISRQQIFSRRWPDSGWDGGATQSSNIALSQSIVHACNLHITTILPPTFCPFVLLASFACYIVITSTAAAAASAAVEVSTRVHRDEAWTAAAAAVIKSAVTQWDWQWRDKVRLLLLLLLFQLIQCNKEKIDCHAKDLLLSAGSFFWLQVDNFFCLFQQWLQQSVTGWRTENWQLWKVKKDVN